MKLRFRLAACGLAYVASLPNLTPCCVAQEKTPPKTTAQADATRAPKEKTPVILATNSNEPSIAALIEQYSADQRTIGARFRIPLDKIGLEFRSNMFASWESKLSAIEFGKLDRDNQIDWLMLNGKIRHDREQMERREERNQRRQGVDSI